ncbi:hypothetical protein ATCC90586_007637 [Pythium insidiosum]|nr:hypothetical protein ATCC90586_007637 [Pythium insidiosum]
MPSAHDLKIRQFEPEPQISVGRALTCIRNDANMKRALMGIPFPIVYFVVFVAMLKNHIMTSGMFDHSHGVSSILDSSGTDAITTDTKMKFRNIGELADVFDWLTDTLAPQVFVHSRERDGFSVKDSWGRIASYNQVVGAVRFDVVNANSRPCHARAHLNSLYPQCYDRAESVADTLFLSFDTNATAAVDVFSRLRDSGSWLSSATSQFTVSIATYNGEIQSFGVTELKVEIRSGGSLKLSSSTTPILADPYRSRHAGTIDILVLVCYTLSLAALVIQWLKLFTSCRFGAAPNTDRPHTFQEKIVLLLWMLLEDVSSFLVGAFYSLWICVVRLPQHQDFIESLQLLATPGLSFAPGSPERVALEVVSATFDAVVRYMVILRIVGALSVLALGLQILSRFRFHPRLNVLTRTVARALHQFAAFFFVFLAIFASFAAAGAVLFGDRVEEFSTFDNTIKSCINMLFGNFDLAVIQDLHYPCGVVFYWCYMIIVALVLLNMMLAIVVDSYSAVCEDSKATSHDVSFTRTWTLLIVDAAWWICRCVGSERVVFGGRISSNILERELTAHRENKDEILTPHSLTQLFPQGVVTEREATATLRFLLCGAGGAKDSTREDGETSVRIRKEQENAAALEDVQLKLQELLAAVQLR